MTEQPSPSPIDRFRQSTTAFFRFLTIALTRSPESVIMDQEELLSDQRRRHDEKLQEMAKSAVGTYSVVTVRYVALTERYRIRAMILVGNEEVELPFEVLRQNIHWIPAGSRPQTFTISEDHRYFAQLWDREYNDDERIVFSSGRRN